MVMISYDVESGRKVHTFIDDCVKDGDLYIRSVCFSPDGQHLATGM
jgi:general transcriptional corepressor TUP1